MKLTRIVPAFMTVVAFAGVASVSSADERTWMTVDLKSGNVSYYDYDFTTATNTFNTEEYKSTKMAFRRIPAGDDYYVQNGSCRAQITNSFYVGVFEVTVAQYELIKDSAYVYSGATALRTQGGLGREAVRGDKSAPSSFGALITAGSPLGLLNSRVQTATGNPKLVFDLPTEAMWEVASRAIAPGDELHKAWSWYFGETKADIDLHAFWGSKSSSDSYGNTSGMRVPGCKLPNAWGLYDVYGNAAEICLDGADGNNSPAASQIEWSETPQISGDGETYLRCRNQRTRGGGYDMDYDQTDSLYRAYQTQGTYARCGIRLFLICSEADETAVMVPSSVTGDKSLLIPKTWFSSFQQFGEKYGTDYKAASVKPNGKYSADGSKMYVWQDYVTGNDPTDSNSVFTVSIAVTNGVPYIGWSPYLNSNGTTRIYQILGKDSLANDVWLAAASTNHFFKVSVSMPNGTEASDAPGAIAGK